MNIRTCYPLLLVTAIGGSAPMVRAADAWITVEIVTEPGVQATAQRDWIKRLTKAGADDVRIRGMQPGDEPRLSELGSAGRPRYKLMGLLDGRGRLSLPGGRFDQRRLTELRDYLERLAADGPEGVTADRGAFGLTKKQTALMHDDLAQPIGETTAGLALADVLKLIDKSTKLEVRMDDAAWQVVRNAEPVADEVETLTIGTAVAILLRRDSLVLIPTKDRGEQVVHRIARVGDVSARDVTAGKGRNDNGDTEVWPIGWKPSRSPSQLAPKLMERINAEVSGFTLAEAMDSIAPRAGIPVYWDHATLRAKQIDPATVDVKLARQKTQLLRIVDRLLFQARLRGKLLVDEAGTPFYWISR